MKKSLFAALLILSCISVAFAATEMTLKEGAHTENELACADCHGIDEPTVAPEQAACESCHGDMTDAEEVEVYNIQQRHKLKVPMHDSHQAPVPCQSCHSIHSESKLFCNDCHMFDVEVP